MSKSVYKCESTINRLPSEFFDSEVLDEEVFPKLLLISSFESTPSCSTITILSTGSSSLDVFEGA